MKASVSISSLLSLTVWLSLSCLILSLLPLVSPVCDELHPCEGLGRYATFRNFGMAFLLLFRVSTGDNWNGIMKVKLTLPFGTRGRCSGVVLVCHHWGQPTMFFQHDYKSVLVPPHYSSCNSCSFSTQSQIIAGNKYQALLYSFSPKFVQI